MKKIFYLFAAISLIFASCTPLEDVYEELDAQGNSSISGDAVYTLTEDDYKSLDLKNTYFTSVEEVKTKIPAFLSEKYPVWGNSSSVTVLYNLFSPIAKETYTVSEADYTAINLTSLNSGKDFNTFFEYKFPNQEKGTIIDLTYLTKPAIIDYLLTTADYELVGNGRFKNFDIREGKSEETIEARRVKIQKILLNNFPEAKVGEKYNVTYTTWNGSESGTEQLNVILTENEPKNATNYTLTDADYELVGNEKYKNFDIRTGKAEETIEVRREKLETILLKNNPDAKEGDLFNVTYKTYDGNSGTMTMLLEFNGTNYDIFSALTYELYEFELENATSRFTYVKDWQAPFTLTEEDYKAMGQKYNNLSGRNKEQVAEAQRVISIYLGQKYPFAQADDFVAVEYNSYAGGGKTNVLNVNYVYDGAKWNAIPEVIEESLQFGHDGITWVPDNTIKYTFLKEDYTSVGSSTVLANDTTLTSQLANLNKYGNFNRTGGDNAWTDEMMLKAIDVALNDSIAPNAAEDQKYEVTVNVYNGSNATETFKVIKKSGKWVSQDSE